MTVGRRKAGSRRAARREDISGEAEEKRKEKEKETREEDAEERNFLS